MKAKLFIIVFLCLATLSSVAQTVDFDGLNVNMGNLSRLSKAKSRSISAENYSGEKGKGGMADPADKDKRNVANAGSHALALGKGWKVNPCVYVNPNETLTLADIKGPGAVQHIWITPQGNWRTSIIRIYWDNEQQPSVECPIGDFFCSAFNQYSPLTSLAVCINPGRALNCYWQMPFRKRCRITIENLDAKVLAVFYQVDYALTHIPADMAYFHAQFRCSYPSVGSLFTIVENVRGMGQYVGTFLAWQPQNDGWWGEGEIKFYMDGDREFPTICGTGTEDYFCGSNNFEDNGKYGIFSTPYSGLYQVTQQDNVYKSGQCFGMYRWHITDPIRFNKELKVTIQDLGWNENGLYKNQKSNISSVAYWYQTEPHAAFPALPSKEQLLQMK